MKKILLLSDTHGFIDDQILKFVHQADEVWHAGDVGNLKVTNRIKELKPLRCVFGNTVSARSTFQLEQRMYSPTVSITQMAQTLAQMDAGSGSMENVGER